MCRRFLLFLLSILFIVLLGACTGEEGTLLPGGSSENSILSYAISSPAVTAVVDATNRTVIATVPYGTDRSALVPIIQVSSNAAVSPGSGVAQDFSSGAVTYTVTAQNGNRAEYSVVVNEASGDDKTLDTFGVVGGIAGGVDDAAKTAWAAVYYSTPLTSLTPVFTVTASGVSNNGSILTSGSGTLDFSSPQTFTVFAANGTTQDYTVVVTNAPARTGCQLSSFSLLGVSGVINDTAGTVAVTLPSGTDVTALTPTAAISDGAALSNTAATAVDFTSPVVYRVTAEDGVTYKDYTVTVTVLSAPSAYITAFCPNNGSSMVDGGETWLDFRVSDPSALSSLGEWRVLCGTYMYTNLLLSASDISSWSLSAGDIVRIHEADWSGSTDSVKSDNNGDKWDFKTAAEYSVNYQYGIIWIEDGSGNIIDLVSYSTSENGSSYWLTSDQDNPLAVLTAAVSGGHWPGNTLSEAFDMGNVSALYARLKNSGTDGGSASDWETHDGSESDPPTVAISSPADGTALTASTVTVSGTAADPGTDASGVKEVWVRADSGTAVQATGTTGWTASVSGLTDGSHTIYAWSVDNSGNCSSTNSVSVTVTLPPDTTNPTVSITSPVSGASVSAGSLVVSGTAADAGTEPSGVAEVWVRVDSGSWTLATGTTSWSCTFTNVSDGSRTISVYSRDAKGNDSATDSVTVTYTYVSSPYSYIVDGKFQPDPSDTYYSYYSSAAGLSGSALLSALHDIIDGHTTRSYDYLYTIYQSSDNTSDGKVWDMYSDIDGTGLNRPYVFSHVSDKCGTYSVEGDCYNREHTIPQSTFGSSSPMVSDAHHVIPTDGKVNGMRSAYPHGDVSSATKTSDNGSKLGPCANSGYSGTVFEPVDPYKGDIARLYLYFSVRYRGNGSCSSWGAMSSGAVLKSWAQTCYTNWHFTDPVSQKEIDRNNAIAQPSAQGNRNPFIDYPGLVLIIDFTQ